jgi:drug/metabolite transporter (DMT)-like permease
MHLTAIAGLQFAPAAHASALGPGFAPVWVMLWRKLAYGAHPDRRQAIGLGLIALGALVLVGYSSWSIFESKMLIGDLLFLLSSCLAAAYLVYVQQHAVDPMQAAALVAVYSGIVGGLLLLTWPTPSAIWTAPAAEVLVQAAFQGVGMGACAVLFASYATLRLGSQRFAIFIAAVPVLSLFFGRAIVGDDIHPYEATAVALVSAGIVIAGLFVRASSVRPSAEAERRSAELLSPRNDRIKSILENKQ